ncbi:MAG: NADPH-dependent FMN reductase [Bacteroidota bacterium]
MKSGFNAFILRVMHITILSSSTRIDRLSHRVALALEKAISERGHTARILDLATYKFPIMEEVLHRHPEPPAGLSDFSEAIRESDALIFLSPEYNGSYTSALKNAVDYLKENEFDRKAIGVVSVTSGPMGGMRGAISMQQLVLGVSGFALPQMLLVPQVSQKFDEQGNLLDPSFQSKTDFFLNNFIWLAEAVSEKKKSNRAE